MSDPAGMSTGVRRETVMDRKPVAMVADPAGVVMVRWMYRSSSCPVSGTVGPSVAPVTKVVVPACPDG